MTKIRLDDLIDGIRAGYPDQPLEQLTAAVLTADHVNEIADHLIGHFVDQARRSGASWTEIGGCIGVTKQAAQQRFTPKESANMFARFTEKARQAVVQSQEEARAAHQPEIRSEHLLLGLLCAPDSLAMRALADQDITPIAIRETAEATVPEAVSDAELPALIPYSAAAKKVIELTVREAVRLGHNYVGTEHMLLALLAGESDAPGPLTALGVDAAAAEAFLLTAIGGPPTVE
ncbi:MULTISPECIES: Clp protease N-terminal domain-containing protein [unclassified Rhodococcus (in: high G+C Gram-positive bacteria)]|uniref:Clp protease N-terminal domain-containing protein n=1 Tax=unclassified Rhodococcus (in: high G+C Gram-positive bacteria) TaxID=192944 RepID=UPI00163B2987|nr:MULTISPECIES: Clp protease N-terminal domain-containing protein [unclassified Rhodococcus (in: high G+C Gram-positive bacteria)]MBC2640509.1 ATP-dependent Clp protease ATP-binding subunit [Rhodococcus sp. 3A]MBC2894745.1 ATP-dependent Clp protease ATP-binding subunit [Rhodococcus sp. 4CII]